MSEKITIQKSFDSARTSFAEWCILSKNTGSEKEDVSSHALNALMGIADVMSRGSMENMCDLLSKVEVQAMIGAIDEINKNDPTVMLKMNHVIQRFLSDFSESIGRKSQLR